MKPKTKSMTWTVALAAVLALVAARPCAADVPNPTPTDLGVLPGYGHNYSTAYAINASGQVVGESYEGDMPSPLPFIWQNGVMTQLPLPSESGEGAAQGINAAGQVAGWCRVPTTEGSQVQACVWTPDGSGWTVTVLGLPDGYRWCVALKINNAGQVLAQAEKWDDLEWESFYVGCVWNGTSWTVLMDGETPLSYPLQMNEQGQVLAQASDGRLVLWNDGTATPIVGDVAHPVEYASMNNLGQVVGVYYDSQNLSEVSFFYLPEAAYGLEAGLHTVSGAFAYRAINDAGLILSSKLVYEDKNGDGNLDTFDGTELTTAYLSGSPGFTCFLPGAEVANALLNANGEVGGLLNMYYGGPPAGFYASAAAGVVLLNGLAQDPYLEATAMNDSGMIIGRSGGHAILWRALTAYSWSGVLPPVNPDGTSVFKAGSTVPVKFMLTGDSAGSTDLAATLSYAKVSDGVAGPVNESVSTSAATTGNLFRYDPAAHQYIFNWSTKGLTRGTYRLFINLGDGVEHTVDVGLK